MKSLGSKTLLLSLFALVLMCVEASAQRNDSLVGTYKIVVKAGMKPPAGPPMYLVLKKNGEYAWAVDAKGNDTFHANVTGSWLYTAQNEIKLVPAITSPMKEIRYFANVGGGVFTLRSIDRNGHKESFRATDMTIQIIKM